MNWITSLILLCSQFLTPQAFKTFFAIIGTNGQGIGTSAFADWVRNVTAFTMPEDDREVLNCIIDDLYEKLDDGIFAPICPKYGT